MMKKHQSSGEGRRSLSDYICNPLSAFIWFFISGGFLILYVFVVLFFNKTRTDDSTQSNKDEGNSPSNYAPRTVSSLEDQGLRVPRVSGKSVPSIKDMSKFTPLKRQHVASSAYTLPTTNKLQEYSNLMACKPQKDEPTCSSVNTEAYITDLSLSPSSPVVEEAPSDIQSDASGAGFDPLNDKNTLRSKEMSDNHSLTQHMTSTICTLPATCTNKSEEHSIMMECKECSSKAVITTKDEEVISDVQSNVAVNVMEANDELFQGCSQSNGNMFDEDTTHDEKNNRSHHLEDQAPIDPRDDGISVFSTKEGITSTFTQDLQQMANVACTLPATNKLQEQCILMKYEEEPTCSSEVIITSEDKEVQNDVTGEISDAGKVCLDSDELDAVEVSNELLGYNGYVFDGHITNDDTIQINDDEENYKIPCTPDNNLKEQGSNMMEYKKEPTCSDDVVIITEDKEMISDIQSDVAGDVTDIGMDSEMGVMEINNELINYSVNEFDGNITNVDTIQTKENNSSNCEVPSTANDFDDQSSGVPRSPNSVAINVPSVLEMITDQLFIQEPQLVTSAACTLPTTNKLKEQSTMMECKEVPTCSSEAVEIVSSCITEDDIVPVLEEMISDIQCYFAENLSDVGMVCSDSAVDVAQANNELLGYWNQLNGNVFDENDNMTQTIIAKENYCSSTNNLEDQGLSLSRNPYNDDINFLTTKGMNTNHLFTQEPPVKSASCILPTTNKLEEQSTMMEKEEPTCSEDVVIPTQVTSDVQSGVAGDVSDIGMVCLDSEMGAMETNNELLGYNGNMFDGNITNDDSTQTNDDEENDLCDYCNLNDEDSNVSRNSHHNHVDVLTSKKMSTEHQEPQQVTSTACILLSTNKLEEQPIVMECTEVPICSSEAVITTEDSVSSCITEDDNVPVLEEVISDIQCDLAGNTSDVEMVYLDHGIVDAVEANEQRLSRNPINVIFNFFLSYGPFILYGDMGIVRLDTEMDAMETNNELLGYNGNMFDGNVTNDDTTQTNDDEENDSFNCEVPCTANNLDSSVPRSLNNGAISFVT